jgi:hypothetical protein
MSRETPGDTKRTHEINSCTFLATSIVRIISSVTSDEPGSDILESDAVFNILQ